MTFLNPLYLFWLAAASIPVILHLLNLRRTRVVEFSTVSFLQELQKSKIRKLKIRQILLLILRTLLIILIVLAFARPALRGSFAGFGGQARTSAVIILDNSFSMSASDEHGSYINTARENARALLDILEPGDEAILLRTADLPSEPPQLTSVVAAVGSEIDDTEIGYAHRSLLDALTMARMILEQSLNVNKEVYVLTDMQRTIFPGDTAGAALRLFSQDTRIFLFPIGEQAASNAAVVSAEVKNSLIQKGRPVTLDAAVRAFGRNLENALVSVYLNGTRVAQQTVDVKTGGTGKVTFTVIPDVAGPVSGYVELEDDALPEDNRCPFGFTVPDKIRVLMAASDMNDSRFVSLALSPGQSAEGVVKPVTIAIKDLDRYSLENYDAVYLFGTDGLSASAIRRLVQYVRNGGGLFFFPSGNGNLPSEEFLRAINVSLSGASFGEGGAASGYLRFGKIDFDHALFEGLFTNTRNTKPSIESPKVFRALGLGATPASRTIISLGNGSPFLLETTLGKGRVLVMASCPVFSQTDLPLRGVFVPLVNRAAFYLSAQGEQQDILHPGQSLDVVINNPGTGGAVFELVAPDNAVVKLKPRVTPSGMHFSLRDFDQPGMYTLRAGNRTLRMFPVAIDPAESNTARLDADEAGEVLAAAGVYPVTIFTGSTDVQRAVQEARYGVELWKLFLVLALICAAAEMLVARDYRRARKEMEA